MRRTPDAAREGAVPRQLFRRRRLRVAVRALLRDEDRCQRQVRLRRQGARHRQRLLGQQLRRRRQRRGRLPLLVGSAARVVVRSSRIGLPHAGRRGSTSARIRARTSSSIRRRASCTKFLAERCAEAFGWDWSRYGELVQWADIIDGAQFESPKAAVELAEPALQLMTWVENNHDPALKLRFIERADERGRWRRSPPSRT